jgi:hypothetical protein
MLDFDKLKTPAPGEVLIEPPPTAWPRLIAENVRAREKYAFTLAGEPAEVAVSETRQMLADGPIIACGHQPAFVHPGVWAKHVVVHQAAQTIGVAGLDFVVDNDAPPSAALPIPVVGADGLVRRREIAFASGSSGSAYEQRPALGNATLTQIRGELSDVMGERFALSAMPRYLECLADVPAEYDAVAQHLRGRMGVDVEFDADLPEARVSGAFGGLFVADLLLNPEPFAVAYNQALAKYRQEQGVRSPDRPLPDLGREADRTETALWIYQPLHRRQRLWVRRAGDRVELFADAQLVGTVAARELAHNPDATLSPWVIRPRALTLTLWARLLACDLFVHGIGGAKYDRITDDIMRRYYRCPPPAYACVTATLRLPLPVFPVTAQTLEADRRRLRDWRFNPQRYLGAPPAEMLAERERLIARSAQLRVDQAPRTERLKAYRAIHELNARLVELEPGRQADLLRRIERVERELASNAVAQSREYFYCLYPRAALAELAGRLRTGW